MNRIGVQTYTVRNTLNTDADCAQTMEKLKSIGCDTVQLFGSVELIERCGNYCEKSGISIIGVLGSLDSYVQDKDALFAVCRKYGIEDIGVSSGVSTYEEAVDYIPRLNQFACEVKAASFSFSYHNHSNEFIRTSCGKTVMDLFLEGFDPACVSFMPDTYWLQHGGCDVRHFLETVKGRIKILHLKDMKRAKDGPIYAEIGSGNLYWEGILKTALEGGVREFVIEQDICDGDPLESIQKSVSYLKSLAIL